MGIIITTVLIAFVVIVFFIYWYRSRKKFLYGVYKKATGATVKQDPSEELLTYMRYQQERKAKQKELAKQYKDQFKYEKRKSYEPLKDRESTMRTSTNDGRDGMDHSAAFWIFTSLNDTPMSEDTSSHSSSFEGFGNGGDFGGGGASGSWDSSDSSDNSSNSD